MIETMKKIIEENTNLARWIEMDLAENKSMDEREEKNLKSLLNMLNKSIGKASFMLREIYRENEINYTERKERWNGN